MLKLATLQQNYWSLYLPNKTSCALRLVELLVKLIENLAV